MGTEKNTQQPTQWYMIRLLGMQRAENTVYNENVNKLMETDSELMQVLELAGKNTEMFVITLFYMSQNVSGDIEEIKKTHF